MFSLKALVASTLLASSFHAIAHSNKPTRDLSTIISIKAGANYSTVMAFLQREGFDVLGVDLPNKIIDLNATSEELEELKKEKIPFYIGAQQALTARLDERYLTPTEIQSFLIETNKKFPEITKLINVGKTFEGRDIFAIKISDNAEVDETDEPSVLFNGMHHAREIMTTEVTTDIITFLTSNYSDPKVKTWVDNNQIFVLPILNVDGNAKVWAGDNMWRKNTRDSHGVDINRNYPTNWGACNGSSSWKSSETYRGASAASEPETNVLMDFVASIKPVFNISYHSYSELVIYPMGCSGQRTSNKEVVEGIGREIGTILNYTPGTSWETLYSVDGSDIDWMYAQHQVIPYVIEVSPRSDGFQPAYEKRNQTVERNRKGWQLLLEKLETSNLSGKTQPFSKLEVTGSESNGKVINYEYAANKHGQFNIILNKGTYILSNSNTKEKFEVNLNGQSIRLE